MAHFWFSMTKRGLALQVTFSSILSVTAYAQDEAIPKAKPKAAPAVTRPAAKPAGTDMPVSGATLLVMCDLACKWKLDGEAKGTIPEAGTAKVRVEFGEHLLSAMTVDGKDSTDVDRAYRDAGQTIVRIELKTVRAARVTAEQEARDQAVREQEAREQQAAAHAEQQRQAEVTRQQQALRLQEQERERLRQDETARLAREEALKPWKDSVTSLMWTNLDNGDDVTWQQATDYCRTMQLAGISDWRLATIDELEGIYDRQANVKGHRVKGNLQLSGWQWSSSPGTASGEAWNFDFTRGLRFSDLLGNSLYGRALCVRGSGD